MVEGGGGGGGGGGLGLSLGGGGGGDGGMGGMGPGGMGGSYRPHVELPNPNGPGVQTIQFPVPSNKCGLVIGKGMYMSTGYR